MEKEKKYTGHHSCAELDAAVDQAALVLTKQDALSTSQLAAVNSGITSEDVAAIAGKQDALTSDQLAAANSGIDSAKAGQIAANTAASADFAGRGGKNCARWVSAYAQTGSNVTFKPQADGSVLVTGESAASARASFRLYLDTTDLKSGDYVLTGCPAGGKSGSTTLYALYFWDETAGARVDPGDDTGDGLPVAWTIDQTHKYSLIIDIRKNTVVGEKTFRPMLIKKDIYDVSPAFESYSDKPAVKRTRTITVAASGADFTSVANAIRFTMNTWEPGTEFTIKVAAGTYDLSGVTTAITGGTLDQRGLFLMPGTKLIGAGSNLTSLTFLYSGSNDDIMSNVSGLNAPYSCEMKGFSLTVKNLRYAIHSDHALATEATDITNKNLQNTTIVLDDVKLVHQGFDDGLTPTYKIPACWGGGSWDGSKRIFRNCYMESYTIAPWFNHDRVDQTVPAVFIFEGGMYINHEISTTVSDSSAACSLCFVSWGAGVKHKVNIVGTHLNKFLTLRVSTTNGNANAVIDYEVSITQSNTIVYEADTNGSRANKNWKSDDCLLKICQTAPVTAYTPVSTKRLYWVHGYNENDTIRGIALNNAAVNEPVIFQTKGYIPLNILTATEFAEGTLLGWTGTAYVEDNTHPLLKVIGGNIAQIIGNGQ